MSESWSEAPVKRQSRRWDETDLLEEPLESFVRDLTPDLALLAHPHEEIFDLLCQLRTCQGYPAHWSVSSKGLHHHFHV
jgi:hypothetical protein